MRISVIIYGKKCNHFDNIIGCVISKLSLSTLISYDMLVIHAKCLTGIVGASYVESSFAQVLASPDVDGLPCNIC